MSDGYETALFLYRDGRRERHGVLPGRDVWLRREPTESSPGSFADPGFSFLSPLRELAFRRYEVTYPPDWHGPLESDVRRYHADTPAGWRSVYVWSEDESLVTPRRST